MKEILIFIVTETILAHDKEKMILLNNDDIYIQLV